MDSPEAAAEEHIWNSNSLLFGGEDVTAKLMNLEEEEEERLTSMSM